MKLRLATLVAILVLLSGCATSNLNKEAFAKPKHLAVVTVMGSVHGLATNDAEDNALMKNLVEVTFKELSKSRHVKLVSQSVVFANRQYKAIKDEGPVMMADMAPGYKRFDPKAESNNLKAMAKALNVDGFVIISAGYGTAKSGMSLGVGGLLPIPLSAGSTKAQATYDLAAVDPNGEIFWRDHAQITSDEGVTTVMGLGNVQALQPELINMTQAASREIVTRLDKQLSGKQ